MYYFASDIHLGHGDADSARERERLFVQWLDEVSADAEEIYLLGDIFDFWYEWGRWFRRALSACWESWRS